MSAGSPPAAGQSHLGWRRGTAPGGDNEYVFYEGPPFANGLPHYGHLLTGYAKDVVPRCQTMRGRRPEVTAAVEAYREFVAREVLARSITFADRVDGFAGEVGDGGQVVVGVRRTGGGRSANVTPLD